jgi:hypothetical protein
MTHSKKLVAVGQQEKIRSKTLVEQPEKTRS